MNQLSAEGETIMVIGSYTGVYYGSYFQTEEGKREHLNPFYYFMYPQYVL